MSIKAVCNACLLGLTLGLFAGLPAHPAQAQQGLGERLGQQLDEGLDRLGEQLQEGWTSLRQTVDRMSVQGRVYSRLRWDKHVATSQFDVDTEEGGIVRLRGKVADAAAKQKAVQLAQDTVGVNRVIDELQVADADDSVVQPEP